MNKKTRVLVVDDSGYVISAVTRKLQNDPDIEVIGSARNGIQAIEKVKALRPDVVTMDVVMPEMDGLTALQHIMAECPTPVLMLSALTSENADTTLRALEMGAVDFFLKPSVSRPDGNGAGDDTLAAKIKSAARQDVTAGKPPVPARAAREKKTNQDGTTSFSKLVVITSSTGGPRALMQLLPALPGGISAAILIIQHMPPVFTKSLAVRLDQASQIRVSEAREGDTVKRGLALMAPGDYHMVVDDGGVVRLTKERPIHGVRPAADVTMKSVARIYGKKSLGVVLTGMGSDGTVGASFIKAAGGRVLAQNEATCAVFGMPASVVNADCADKLLPLNEIADEIICCCEK